MYTPTAILVTGGSGFIGSNFLNYMLKKYPQITFVNLDAMKYCASEKNVHSEEAKNYVFVKGNILSGDLIDHILRQYKIDTVIHFAAQSHVCNSFNESLTYTKDNVVGTHTLLERVRQYGKVTRFIHVSTDEVYGEIDVGSFHEKSLLYPTNPYAASKAAAEMIANSYYKSYGIPLLITRGNNVWGPNQYPEKLIPKFINHLLAGEKCTVHGKGQTRRNFLHAEDVARAFESILFSGEVGEIYNIGTDNEYTVLEIAEMLRQQICPDKQLEEIVETVPDRLFNDTRYSVDSKKLRGLGWKEQVDFVQELPKVIQWYRENGKTHWVR